MIGGGVSLSDRLSLLRANPAFAVLPLEAQLDLAKNLKEETFRPEEIVIKEGAEADRLYVVVEGLAEAITDTQNGEIVLKQMGPGEVFGEIALLTPGARRTATVRATATLLVLSLENTLFTKLLQTYPDIRSAFEMSTELLLTAKFLKQASPFSTLNPDNTRDLVNRLKKISLPASARVVKQGDEGDSCYLIRKGKVEVIFNEGKNDEKALAVLEAGSLFGEASLLTSSPRNATVKTLSPCEFYELKRCELIQVMGLDRNVSGRMMELLSLRNRPCRIRMVVANHRTTSENTTITILKDPKRHVYFQLSPEGWFVWQMLDGEHTLRDITLNYLQKFKSFSPHTIAEIIGRLSSAGFLSGKKPDPDVQKIFGRVSFWKRMIMMAHKIVEFRVMWTGADRTFDTLYRGGGWLFYTWPAQILLAAVSLAGAIVFASEHLDIPRALSVTSERPVFFLLLAAAFLFTIFAHELGHAFTTKKFGREVSGMGIGWYWFGPTAFVDTSDMWLATRRQRIAVTLAGPYTNLLLAGIASLTALFVSDPHVRLGLWFFALGSYIVVIVNLNPLLEYDGYYALIDILEHPNLRAHCLSWLGKDLPQALGSPQKFRGHTLELLYGIGSLLYVVAMALLAMFVYHIVLKKWITEILPDWVASGLAWVAAFIIVAACVLTVVGELRSEDKRNP